jgi:hypothetical protein
MRCVECGAELTGAETCLDRFHALLAAEWDHPEGGIDKRGTRHQGARPE